jgi:hypothetical protein
MNFHNQDRETAVYGRGDGLSSPWATIAAYDPIIAPGKQGEDKPSPLPYTAGVPQSLPMLVATIHYRAASNLVDTPII